MIRDLIGRIGPLFNKDSGAPVRIALDIGTEYVKAVYVELADMGPRVLGVGRARQDYANMEGGAVADIGGVTACCREALEQGAVIAGVKAKDVVLGIAGQFVHGVSRTVGGSDLEQKSPSPLGTPHSSAGMPRKKPSTV